MFEFRNFILLFFKHHDCDVLFLPVENCESDIRNKKSLVRTHQRQSFYQVTCEKGHHLRHRDQNHECKEGKWFPEIICEPDNTHSVMITPPSYGK